MTNFNFEMSNVRHGASKDRESPSFADIIRIPKVDLHRHITGSIMPETAFHIAQKHKLDLVAQTSSQLRRDFFSENRVSTHADYFRPWSILGKLFSSLDAVRDIILSVARDAAKDNVIYTELRMGPRGHDASLRTQTELYSFSDFLDVVSAAVQEAERLFGTHIRCILGVSRHTICELSHLQRRRLFENILVGLCSHRDYFVGVDLNGDELALPLSAFTDFFKEAASQGLGVTVHAGEVMKDPSEVKYAVNVLNVDRIGHGIAAAHSEETMRLLASRGTVLEICPSSNQFLNLVETVTGLPLKTFRSRQVPFVICTDNPVRCNTTLSQELHAVSQALNMSRGEIEEMMRLGVASSFANDTLKAALLTRFDMALAAA